MLAFQSSTQYRDTKLIRDINSVDAKSAEREGVRGSKAEREGRKKAERETEEGER